MIIQETYQILIVFVFACHNNNGESCRRHRSLAALDYIWALSGALSYIWVLFWVLSYFWALFWVLSYIWVLFWVLSYIMALCVDTFLYFGILLPFVIMMFHLCFFIRKKIT